MTMSRIAALSLALSLAGCATTGRPPSASKVDQRTGRFAMADGTVVVCEMERPTGSHMLERVCYTERSHTPLEEEQIQQLFNHQTVQTRVGN